MKIEQLLATEQETISEVMHTIDRSGLGIAIITKNDKLTGIATTGDIRRALFKGRDAKEPIATVMNKDYLHIRKNDLADKEHSKKIQTKARAKQAHYIPITNEKHEPIHLAHREELGPKSIHQEIQKTNKERVLIVGGAGYLGSILAEKLIHQGYKVRVLDLCLFGEETLAPILLHPAFELMRGDIRNIPTVTKALEDIDIVIHLAGIVGDPASKQIPLETIEINLLATRLLAEACKYNQINKFLFASTCSVYGLGEGPLTEEAPLRPVSLYGRLKMQSEDMLREMTDNNFRPTILRMATLHGPSRRMRFDLVVNILTAKALIEKEITIYGGNQWRPLLHVEDAAQAFIQAMKAPLHTVGGHTFNVGHQEENYQIKELANIIEKELGAITINYEGEDDERDYQVDFTKIQETINFKPKKTVQQSIQEIKTFLEARNIKNYKQKKYHNVATLT